MKAAKRRAWGLAAAVVCVCCVFSISMFHSPEERLSAEQVAELRAQYPVCGKHLPATISMRIVQMDEVMNLTDTFVYGEVVGDISKYHVSASVGNEALEEKRNSNGIADVFEFYEYTLSVLSDSEGIYAKGDTITIASNAVFIDYYPSLSEGMKIIVPVVQDKDKPTRNYYWLEGMYYVTPEGYAIPGGFNFFRLCGAEKKAGYRRILFPQRRTACFCAPSLTNGSAMTPNILPCSFSPKPR